MCKQWLASLWLVSASSLCGCGLVTREVQVQLPPYITANQAATNLSFVLWLSTTWSDFNWYWCDQKYGYVIDLRSRGLQTENILSSKSYQWGVFTACILHWSDYHACAVPGDLTTARYQYLLPVMRLFHQVTSVSFTWATWTPLVTSDWPHHGRRHVWRWRSRDIISHPQSGCPYR